MLLAPVIDIFCDIDDFYKEFSKKQSIRVLPNPNHKRQRKSMSASEIICILILFHLNHYRTFKDFYIECVLEDLKPYFPRCVSYNRFVEIYSSLLVPLTAYILLKTGRQTNLYYLDSTTLKVCHNRRISRHQVFKGIAQRGKSFRGWFYRFKLHIAINYQGEWVSFCLTIGNVDA